MRKMNDNIMAVCCFVFLVMVAGCSFRDSQIESMVEDRKTEWQEAQA